MGKKEQTKTSKIKDFFRKIKKLSNSQTEQKKQKKAEKEKLVTNKPKGYQARKMGVVAFWTVFGFMFLIVFVNIAFGSSSAEVDVDELMNESQNHATSQEAVNFAESFATDYFTWEIGREGIEAHANSLDQYLTNSVDKHGGLNINDIEQNSVVERINLRDIKAVTDDISQITFHVQYRLFDDVSDGGQLAEQFFVVPIATDGETFGVYELPKFTQVADYTTVDSINYHNLTRVDSDVRQRVDEFLGTFFGSFASDNQSSLNYILAENGLTQGLEGNLTFNRVSSSEIYQLEQEEEEESTDRVIYSFTEVEFTDDSTGLSFTTNYELEIVEREGRLVVSGIDEYTDKQVQSISNQPQNSQDDNTEEDDIAEEQATEEDNEEDNTNETEDDNNEEDQESSEE